MSGLFLTLLNRSLAACWLILALLILRPLLRRVSRTLCCALWGLVAFRLLCPFSIRSVLSLIPSATPIPMDLIVPGEGISAGTQMGGDLLAPAPPVVDSFAPAVVSPAQTVLRIAVAMWITGVALFALYAVLSYLRMYLYVRFSARQNGYWVCDRIKAPFVLGMVRPRIYLPLSANPCDIPYILAHESAHLARRDHWRKPIAYALLAIFWFQPLMWVAFILLCRDVEFACDEHALRVLGVDARSKKAYAEALLRNTNLYKPAIACPLAFGGLQVKQRVRSVVKYRRPAAIRVFAMLLVCCVVAVCFLTDPEVGAGVLLDISENGSGASADPAAPDAEAPQEGNAAKQPNKEEGSSWPKDAKPAEVIRTPIEPSVVAYANGEAPPWELEAAFALCHQHFNLYPISGEESPTTVIMVTNDGEEDGSVTYLVLDESCSYGVEILTILLPAGEKTLYDFGRIAGYVSIGASYNGASAMLPLRPYVTG